MNFVAKIFFFDFFHILPNAQGPVKLLDGQFFKYSLKMAKVAVLGLAKYQNSNYGGAANGFMVVQAIMAWPRWEYG